MTIEDVPNILISLANRGDRRVASLPQFEREGLPVEVLDALTGADASRSGLRAFAGVTSGGLGGLASHLSAWRQIATSGAAFGVVYEDDVVLVEGFRALADWAIGQTPEWELLQFGWFTSVRYRFTVRARTALRESLARRTRQFRVERSLFRDGGHAYAIANTLADAPAAWLNSTHGRQAHPRLHRISRGP